MKNHFYVLCMGAAFSCSVFAAVPSDISLTKRLNGHSLSCKVNSGEIVTLKNENGGIKAEGLCFGGDEIQIETTANFVVISCGDDGVQNTLFAISAKGVKVGDTVDGSTYLNVSPGYPYADGQVKYLTCTVN